MKLPSFAKFIISVVLVLGSGAMAMAQVVSAGLSGLVRDTAGNPVANAAVTATHTPTNSVSTVATNQFGRFQFRGLPVGGPFSVSASATGTTAATANDIFTELGTDVEVTITLKSDIITMEKFVATAERNDLDGSATGSGTIVDGLRISMQPSVNKSFADMMRTNPFVSIRAGGDRVVALGQNNKYNAISVDGARINDSFGLNASGLASFNNPFSLEALEQFSVELSPYDVRRSGFTGASINAVTKSGTNEFHGSAYYITTNDDLGQRDIVGASAGQRLFSEEKTYGYTFGGPIIKNKLFFFGNWERYVRDSLPVSTRLVPDATVLSAIQTRLNTIADGIPGDQEFGSITGGANRTLDVKRVIKFDWNIAEGHRATFRFSDTVGSQPSFGGLNATNFSGGAALPSPPAIGIVAALSSNFYTQQRTEKVWAAQLFSSWSPDLKTQFAYSKVSFKQESLTPIIFPEVRIYNVPGVDANTGAALTNGVIVFGTENSRHGNAIDVLTQTYSGSADYTKGRFTFTAGADYEKSNFLNLFRQSSYGVFGYDGLTNFQNDTPFGFLRSISQTGLPIADISKFEQTGLFAQVKTEVSSRLNFTLGIRYDDVGSPIRPNRNTAFETAFGVRNDGTIDGTSLFAPRASFNYALDDERTTQVRGGLGVVLGRNPWVWISSAYGGTGIGRANDSRSAAQGAPSLVSYLNTSFDPANPIGTAPVAASTGAAAITFIEDGLKMPSVIRGNLAVDRKVAPLNATLTLEYIHTDVKDAMFFDNLNLRPIAPGADGRARFAGSAATAPRITGYANVLRTRNVDTGGSQYFSVSLDRPMRNDWMYNVAYTRGYATEAQNLGSTTAGSVWQFNAVFNQNAVETRRSDYEIRNRIQATVGKRFRFFRDAPTTISLYYEGRSGSPYSWVYTSDLNGDGFASNDVVAVPSGANDARFDFSQLTSAQLASYLAFFNDNGMGQYAGSYAPKNEFLQPWQSRLDLHFSQELPGFKQAKLELFADFLNFGSWLSRDLFNYIETLGVPTNTGLVRNIGSNAASTGYGPDGRIRPTATTFDATGAVVVPASNSAITVNNGESRWKIQVGARLKF